MTAPDRPALFYRAMSPEFPAEVAKLWKRHRDHVTIIEASKVARLFAGAAVPGTPAGVRPLYRWTEREALDLAERAISAWNDFRDRGAVLETVAAGVLFVAATNDDKMGRRFGISDRAYRDPDPDEQPHIETPSTPAATAGATMITDAGADAGGKGERTMPALMIAADTPPAVVRPLKEGPIRHAGPVIVGFEKSAPPTDPTPPAPAPEPAKTDVPNPRPNPPGSGGTTPPPAPTPDGERPPDVPPTPLPPGYIPGYGTTRPDPKGSPGNP